VDTLRYPHRHRADHRPREAEQDRAFSICPDGTRFVIKALSKGHERLFVRALNSEEAVELDDSLDATSHFLSPDSRRSSATRPMDVARGSGRAKHGPRAPGVGVSAQRALDSRRRYGHLEVRSG